MTFDVWTLPLVFVVGWYASLVVTGCIRRHLHREQTRRLQRRLRYAAIRFAAAGRH